MSPFQKVSYDLAANDTTSALNLAMQGIKWCGLNAKRLMIDVSQGINIVGAPIVNGISKVANVAFDEHNRQFIGSGLSSIAFGALFTKGLLTIRDNIVPGKWYSIENRFRSEKQLKVELKPLQNLIPNIPTSHDKTIKNKEDDIKKAQNDIIQLEIELSKKQTSAVNNKTLLRNLEEDLKKARKEYNYHSLHSEDLFYIDDLSKKCNEIENQLKQVDIREESNALSTKISIKKEELKNLQSTLDVDKSKAKKEQVGIEVEEPNKYYIGVTRKKTEKSENETHIPLPLSNDCLVIKHREMKDAFFKVSGGAVMTTTGFLGFADRFYAFLGSRDRLDAFTTLENSKVFFNDPIRHVAAAIGNVVQIPINSLGVLLGSVETFNESTLGLGNVIGGAGLMYAGYACIKSTKFTWFDYKQRSPFIQTPMIIQDLLKVVSGVSLISAGILSINSFFKLPETTH